MPELILEEIKKRVYGKLYDLFGDKCLYVKEWIDLEYERWGYNPADNPKTIFCESIIDSFEDNPEWIILVEILPTVIQYKNQNYSFTFIRWFWRTDKIEQKQINYNHGFHGLLRIGSFPNIWQALLNLLEAIESHPDRDNFQYKWGDKE